MAEKDYKYFKSKTNRGVYIQAPVGTSQEVIERLAKDIPKGTYNVDDLVIGETKREAIPTTKSVPTAQKTTQPQQVQPQQTTSQPAATLPTSTAKYVPGQGVVSEDQIKDQQATYQLGQLKQQAESKQAPVVTEEQKQGYTLQQAGKDFKGGMDAMAHGAVPFLTANIISTPIVNTINEKLGTNFQTPEEGMTELFKRAGIAEPETGAQKMVSGMTDALITTAATAGTGAALKAGGGLGQSVAKGVGQQLAARTPEQLAGATGGVLGSQLSGNVAEQLNASPGQQLAAELAGGIIGDIAGSKLAQTPANISRALNTPIPQQKVQALQDTAPYGQLRTTELTPPSTQKATTMQRIREGIPGGAGELQFQRAQERVDNVKNLMTDYGIDVDDLGNTPKFSEALMDDFLDTRQKKLELNVDAKKEVISDLTSGEVPVPKVTEFLENAGAEVDKRDTSLSNKLGLKIREWEGALKGKDLDTLEKTRKDLLDELSTSANEDIAKQGTTILNEAYKELVEDMGDYIKTNGSDADFTKWKVANKNLSDMASEFNDKALFSLLKEGKKNPDAIKVEDIDKLLFSKNPSDIEKLYGRLSKEGKGIAKTALISKFADEANPADLSPEKFAKAIQKYGENVKITFNDNEVKRLKGLKKYLDMTSRAEEVVRGSRGYTGLPTSDIPGTGTAISMGIRSSPLAGLMLSGASTVGLGKVAQIYENNTAIRNLMAQMAELKPESRAASEVAKRINRTLNTVLQEESEGDK